MDADNELRSLANRRERDFNRIKKTRRSLGRACGVPGVCFVDVRLGDGADHEAPH